MKRRLLGVAIAFGAFLFLACGDSAPPPQVARPLPTPPPTSAPHDLPPEPPTRDDGRLSQNVVPQKYSLAFRVTPADERFNGTTKITVQIKEPTSFVVLHAHNLHVTRISAVSGAHEYYGGSHLRLAHGARDPEELVLSFYETLPAGEATLTLEYDAPFDGELSGLYRVRENERYYAFTQFESTYARRAFPCFDEPGFKTPYDVSIRAPWGLIAIGNTKEVDRVADGDGTIFRFATTKPLPSYLVAFGVGDFDVREGPRSPVPIRAITIKGKQDLAGLAIDASAKLIAELSTYFGMPYPYDKLDIVAVPNFAAGAMENPGFVTFREELLLLSNNASKSQKRSQAKVIAHEFAHQWFGDLVTAAWWDDLFLNEGFATWMENVAVDRAYPDFGAHDDANEEMSDTFDLDALASSRAIRQPVTSTDDALEAFDAITYDKGGAVLGMLEAYVGHDAFQRGVRAYLNAHAWKNATATDLLSALDSASGKNVTSIANAFLDRPGVPLIRTKITCEKKPAKYTLSFDLDEWVPRGSEKTANPTWSVPVCYRVDGDKAATCVTIDKSTPARIEAAGTCPGWVHPNAEARGYYRFAMEPEAFGALLKNVAKLDVASRVAAISNAWASVRSGDLPIDRVLTALPLFDSDHERHVVSTVIDALSDMSKDVIPSDARLQFQAYCHARLSGHARALAAKTHATDDDILERREVDSAMVKLGGDRDVAKHEEELAREWLKDPTKVDPDAAQIAIEIASGNAGEPRFSELVSTMKNAKDPGTRVTALRGLASFDDPTLIDRALDLALKGEVKAQDVRYLLRTALGRRTSRAHAADFVMAHWDEFKEVLPGELGSGLVRIVATACDQGSLDKLSSFVGPKAKTMNAADREYKESVERARLCVDLRARQEPNASAFFKKTRH